MTRLSAAIIVVISHFAYSRLSGDAYLPIRHSKVGSDAVILFFVLSGYVIAYVTETKDRNGMDYAISRLSRLYSVGFPALIVTLVLDQIGRHMNPELYDGWWYRDSNPAWRFFANLFFINELWFSTVRPFSNGPYWSVCYEFWYYALFGAGFYFTGRTRLILVLSAFLIAGPKIMVLLPIWLLGVWTYRVNQRMTFSVAIGWLLFLAPIVIYIVIKSTGFYSDVRAFSIEILGDDFVRKQLKFSDEFLISYLYGILVATNFIGAKSLTAVMEKFFAHFEGPIRSWAGLTFSLYLLHYPLLHFFAALYGGEVHDPRRHLLLLASVFMTVAIIGNFTEKKKHLVKRMFINLPRRLGRT